MTRNCGQCKHLKDVDTGELWASSGEVHTLKACEKWECHFEAKDADADAVKEAYNRGYADGMKAQAQHMRLCNEER